MRAKQNYKDILGRDLDQGELSNSAIFQYIRTVSFRWGLKHTTYLKIGDDPTVDREDVPLTSRQFQSF